VCVCDEEEHKTIYELDLNSAPQALAPEKKKLTIVVLDLNAAAHTLT
jgi:hypothetical protein